MNLIKGVKMKLVTRLASAVVLTLGLANASEFALDKAHTKCEALLLSI